MIVFSVCGMFFFYIFFKLLECWYLYFDIGLIFKRFIVFFCWFCFLFFRRIYFVCIWLYVFLMFGLVILFFVYLLLFIYFILGERWEVVVCFCICVFFFYVDSYLYGFVLDFLCIFIILNYLFCFGCIEMN